MLCFSDRLPVFILELRKIPNIHCFNQRTPQLTIMTLWGKFNQSCARYYVRYGSVYLSDILLYINCLHECNSVYLRNWLLPQGYLVHIYRKRTGSMYLAKLLDYTLPIPKLTSSIKIENVCVNLLSKIATMKIYQYFVAIFWYWW